MGDVGQSGRDRLSPDVENICPPFRGGQDDCCGVALAFCAARLPHAALWRGDPPARENASPSVRLALLAEGILPGLGLLPCQSERRERGTAFFLLVPLRLRLLLLLVAAHLTLGHDVPPMSACPRARAVGGLKRRWRADSSGVSLALLRRSVACFAVRPISDCGPASCVRISTTF